MRTFMLALTLAMLVGCQSAPPQPQVFASPKELDERVIALLKAKNFAGLEDLIEGFVHASQADPAQERNVDRAFDAFYRANPELEPFLTSWVTERPDSYAAHLARGIHYAKTAWDRRGAHFSVTQKQREGMQVYVERALRDVDKAIALNGRSVHALCYKLEIHAGLGERDKADAAYRQALKLNPLSLTARWIYMNGAIPRWGGSMALMEREVEAAKQYYARNPSLKLLEGRIPLEYGDQALLARDYRRAIPMYNDALKHGRHPYFLLQRAEAYSKTNQHGPATIDLNSAVTMRPNYPRAWYLFGFSMYVLRQYGEAIEMLGRSLEAEPHDARAWDIRGDAYLRLGKAAEALADFERALALEPNNAEYQEDVVKAKRALKPVR